MSIAHQALLSGVLFGLWLGMMATLILVAPAYNALKERNRAQRDITDSLCRKIDSMQESLLP